MHSSFDKQIVKENLLNFFLQIKWLKIDQSLYNSLSARNDSKKDFRKEVREFES